MVLWIMDYGCSQLFGSLSSSIDSSLIIPRSSIFARFSISRFLGEMQNEESREAPKVAAIAHEPMEPWRSPTTTATRTPWRRL